MQTRAGEFVGAMGNDPIAQQAVLCTNDSKVVSSNSREHTQIDTVPSAVSYAWLLCTAREDRFAFPADGCQVPGRCESLKISGELQGLLWRTSLLSEQNSSPG